MWLVCLGKLWLINHTFLSLLLMLDMVSGLMIWVIFFFLLAFLLFPIFSFLSPLPSLHNTHIPPLFYYSIIILFLLLFLFLQRVPEMTKNCTLVGSNGWLSLLFSVLMIEVIIIIIIIIIIIFYLLFKVV